MKTTHLCGSLSVLVMLLVLSFALKGEEIKHYKSYCAENGRTIEINHFELGDMDHSFALAQGWLFFEGGDGLLARYVNRAVEGCSIEIRMIPLASKPENEKDAVELYRKEIQKMTPPPVDKGTSRLDPGMECLFPRTFVLANGPKDRPTRIATFFIRPPALYQVIIQFKDQLVAQPRLDYQTLIRSFRIEAITPPKNEVAGL
ncbi:MAG: hypothetical protein PHV34_11190 [Verrucomicrobiae bacterium]|nr:hypothetical protein [Verrucomicrobiae bacterium]